MRIMFINSAGGTVGHIDVDDGITLGQLFDQKVPDRDPEDFLKRVNRQEASEEKVIQEGDRVSFTPANVHGA